MEKPPVRPPILLPASLVNLAKRIYSLGEGLHIIVVIADVIGPKFIVPIFKGGKVEDLRPPKATDKEHEVKLKT